MLNPELFQLLFQLRVELKGEKAFKLNGSLKLPVEQDWIRICNSPELIDAFGKACTDAELTSKIARIWKRSATRDLAHAPVRREFSLPVIDKPSGGFRIRRTNLFGDELYQVHAINAKNTAALHLQTAMLIGPRGFFLTSFSTKI